METVREFPHKNRYIVLIPEFLAGNTDLAYKIHHNAVIDRRDVVYLAVVEDQDRLLSTSRALATMTAATAGDQVNATSSAVTSVGWLAALCALYRPGDVVICQQEHTVHAGHSKPVPVQQVIATAVNAPVKTITGFYQAQRPGVLPGLIEALYWIGLVLVLGAFFWLDVKIDQAISGSTQSLLLILVFAVELAVLFGWNALISNRNK